MEAKLITDRALWNDFVASSVCCNITQTFEWGELAYLRGKSQILHVGVVGDDGKLCAAMYIQVLQMPIIRSKYFYAPRGPVVNDPDSPAMDLLLDFVKDQARKYHACCLKIEPSVFDGDVKWLSALKKRGFQTNPKALHMRHEWVLDIRPSEDQLQADMERTCRYNIRLAGRKGIVIRETTDEKDFDTYYGILQITSKRDNFHIYEKEYYWQVFNLYRETGNAVLFMAEYEGQAVAGALIVKMGEWCWYLQGASSNEHRDRKPNHLLQWVSIQWAKKHGCSYYNFRGIPDILEEDQPMFGVYAFKRSFGGFAMRSLQTHDLAYNPVVYRLYRQLLDVQKWTLDQRAKRAEAARAKAKEEAAVAKAQQQAEKAASGNEPEPVKSGAGAQKSGQQAAASTQVKPDQVKKEQAQGQPKKGKTQAGQPKREQESGKGEGSPVSEGTQEPTTSA